MNLSCLNTRVARAVALAAACGALLFSTKAAGQIVLQPGPEGYDTVIGTGSNQGNRATLMVGHHPPAGYRSLIQFDLTSVPPGYVLSSATLVLSNDWVGTTAQFAYRIFVWRVTEPWDEMQATWDDRITGTPWSTPGGGALVYTGAYCDFTFAVDSTANFDVTGLVNEWLLGVYPNYGLLIEAQQLWCNPGGGWDPDDTWVQFRSSDSTPPSARPKLTLNGSVPSMTTFSFQGRLNQAGAPANGAFDFQFAPFATAAGGTPLTAPMSLLSLPVAGGYFSALLDFGNVFDGTPRWIEVQVRASGATDYTILSPRQFVTTTPYAIRAQTATTALALAGGTSPSVPSGVIVMWSGAIGAIPTGWHLCDGTAGTPDLRDRFVLGTRDGEAPGDRGGTHQVYLTVAQLPSHGHNGSIGVAGDHAHTYTKISRQGLNYAWGSSATADDGYEPAQTSTTGAHSHAVFIEPTGGWQPFDNRPAYYRLAYIMKL